jgi:hypothetical protein
MVTPEEVDESLQQEVAAECSNFGVVQVILNISHKCQGCCGCAAN